MNKYKITMRSGMTHEVEKKSNTAAKISVWMKYYPNWNFKDFIKQVEKIERVTE